MKLFWRQLICMVGLVAVSLLIFGTALMYSSFKGDIEIAKQQLLMEGQFYRYSIMDSLNNLPKDYEMVDMVVADVAKIAFENVGEDKSSCTIYNAEKNIVYASSDYKSQISRTEFGEKGAYLISESQGIHYIESMMKTETSRGIYYLEISQNIQYIYDDREELMKGYKSILAVILLLTCVISMIMSFRLTNPVKKLSDATVDFAKGNYKRRVRVRGNDEISSLMDSFNYMADELEKSIWQLKENARRQEEFSGAFAHELKTPLTSIIGYSEMLMSMSLSEKEQKMCANYIYGQGKRLESIAMKMMQLTNIKSQNVEMEDISTRNLAIRVKKMISALFREKHLKLMMDVEDEKLYADMVLLESLFSNLLDNARKASNENSYIFFSGKKDDGKFVFQVTDYGCGIPKEDIKKVTEAFYMVDKSRARKEGGAGIGMSLCERIVKLHGGTLEIESEQDYGTCVTVTLPLDKEENGMVKNMEKT